MTVTDIETTTTTTGPDDEPSSGFTVLARGTRVEVRSSFDQRWTSGFEVVDADGDGYRLRRLSDGAELPGIFRRDALRRERRRGQWWYS
jgi:hypothetical protein